MKHSANLLDNTGKYSGAEMIITEELQWCRICRCNHSTGVFPASVMSSNYWTDAGQTSEVKFDNLDVRKKYRIGCFFGSAISTGYFSPALTIHVMVILLQLNSYE